jgi:4-amino-4-deoxy-L-arabinose transferase-like glycosyltransferase
MVPLKNQYERNSPSLPSGMTVLREFATTKSFFYLLLGVAVFILIAHLDLPPLWGSEGRWAVIARSMFRSGDLFSPVLGVGSYWDKPLLSYWQILPISYLSGGVSEFTARFPSVVWAVIMLLLTHGLAKRWFGKQTALLSIGILATSFDFVFYGRDAQVEMTNGAMILLCLWYFIRHKSDPTHRWVYLFGILMALGANMKGLVVYGVPIFGIVLLSIIRREWSWIPPLRILITAGLLSLAVFLVLPVAAGIHSATLEPLRTVWRENVLRFFGLYDHKDPFYTYFVKIFYLASPWSLLLPVAIVHCLRGVGRRVSQIPEVLILFGAIFLFFTLSGSRRSYYLLPILPFVAILVANVLREFAIGTLGQRPQAVVRVIGVLLGVALSASSGVSLVLPQIFPVKADTLWYALVLLLLLGTAMMVSTIKKYVWGMIGSVFAVWLLYVIVGIPLIAEGPNLKTKIAEVKALGGPYGFLNIDDARLEFYLDEPRQVFNDESRAFNWAIQTKGVVIASSDVSSQSWECLAKNRHWQAVIPRMNSLSNDPRTSR